VEAYSADTYGQRIAPVYDELYTNQEELAATVGVLAELAGAGPVLELAVGTGRVAIPLAELGLAVDGVDASPAMLDRLHAKPGADGVRAMIGDIANLHLDKDYALTFIVFNTLFCLLTAADQKSCFSSVARHLRPGGRFVVEAFVPDLSRFDRGQRVSVVNIAVDRVRVDVSSIDLANQRIDSSHLHIENGRVDTYPVAIRYAWPSELDLMAELAGLRLAHRWGGWHKEPFTSKSNEHVSVYEK
jgi:SAM-dependent methyltransferase